MFLRRFVLRPGFRSIFTLLGLIAVVAASPATADDPLPGAPRDTIVWSNPAGGDWSNPANWTPANVPDSPFEAAILKPLTGAYEVTLGSSWTLGGLVVQGGGPALHVRNGATLLIKGIPYNYGTIRVSEAGTFRPYWGLFENTGGKVVSGTDGGSLLVVGIYPESPGTIDNTGGGTLEIDGGSLTLYSGTIVNGEIRRTSGDGAVRIQLATAQNVVVTPGSEVVVTGLLDLMAAGSVLHNYGTVRVPGQINAGGNGTITFGGDGEVVLEGGILDTPIGGTLVNSANHTIRGCGTIRANIANLGTIDASCEFGYFTITAPYFQNYNVFRALGGVVRITGSSTEVYNFATMSVSGWMWIDGGATLKNGSGVLRAEGGTVDFSPFTSSCTIEGGRLEATGAGTFYARGNTTLRDVTLGSSATLVTESGGHTTASGARLLIEGTHRIAQQGRLTVASATDYVQTGGATILQGGQITSTREIQIQGGELRGKGTIAGSVANGGEVSPEVGSGALAILGNYHQLSAGRLSLGIASATLMSRLTVTGVATLDGMIEAATIGGYTPGPGTQFEVLSYGSSSGQFSDWDVDMNEFLLMPVYDVDGVALSVSSAVGIQPGAPAPTVLRFYGSGTGVDASFVLELPQESAVTIRAYDATGREVGRLAEGMWPAGPLQFRLDRARAGLPSGAYFARATVVSGGRVETRTARVILLR